LPLLLRPATETVALRSNQSFESGPSRKIMLYRPRLR
jgi:hypothetical protein